MKASITNTSRAPQGVHSVDGLVFVQPGASRVVDVHEDYVERVKSLPFFDAKWQETAKETRDPAAASAPPKKQAPKAKGKKPVDEKREDLKKQASELGIEFAANIPTDKLQALVDAKLAS